MLSKVYMFKDPCPCGKAIKKSTGILHTKPSTVDFCGGEIWGYYWKEPIWTLKKQGVFCF